MKSLSITALALAVTLVADGDAFGQPGRFGRGRSGAARNGWVFSLTEGRELAKKSGKPLMVVFRCEP